MKLWIITRHAIPNYGSFLQSYATLHFFKDMGFDTEIINYIPIDEKIENIFDTYIYCSHNKYSNNMIYKILYKTLQNKNIKNMETKFLNYRNKYLSLSNECNTTGDLQELSSKYDI